MSLNPLNDLLLSNLSVRLRECDNSQPIGSGVLYYHPDLKNQIYILTAAHCLYKDGDSFAEPREGIKIDLFNGEISISKKINYNLVSACIERDVAIIVVDKNEIPSVTDSLPRVEIIKNHLAISTFVAKGFPFATQGKEIVCIYPKWNQDFVPECQFQLKLNDDYNADEINGFSGSGIYLHTDNKLFLMGIFTRYREEGRGRIIYCQYINQINQLLKENYLSPLPYSFIGGPGLTRDDFSRRISKAISDLGPRFNEELNFRLPIVSCFEALGKENIYKKKIQRIIDRWLLNNGRYDYGLNDHLNSVSGSNNQKLQEEHLAIKEFVKSWFNEVIEKWEEPLSIHTEDFIERINLYNITLDEASRVIDLPTKSTAKEYEKCSKIIKHIYEQIELNNSLLQDLKELNIGLFNNPLLLIKGDAGCGKSHLLGDISNWKIKEGKPVILLLGQQFIASQSISQNIITLLDYRGTFSELLNGINEIGKQINSRVLFMIDALNEGGGKELWRNGLSGFIDEIASYPFISLVITVRSTYYNAVIPEQVQKKTELTQLTHQGFAGNEYAALRLFCEYYELKQPQFPILNPEFTNPLFLHLICQTAKSTPSKEIPLCFEGLTNIYIDHLEYIEKKLEEKREEYATHQGIVKEAIYELAYACYKKINDKKLTYKEAETLFREKFNDFRFLMHDLIAENVIVRNLYRHYRNGEEIETIYFAYERFGDFYMAEQLLNMYSSEEEVRMAFKEGNEIGSLLDNPWKYEGIIEAMASLLPEKFSLELFEVYDWVFEDTKGRHTTEGQIIEYILNSLRWRQGKTIDDEKISKWLNSVGFKLNYDWLNRLIEMSALPSHPFNSDRLNNILKRFSMADRDSFWQKFLLHYTGTDEGQAFPFSRLVDWAWQPGVSTLVDAETARLTAQTLIWGLATTNRQLRDQTTKALINLLEEQLPILIKLMIEFQDVSDLYIAERLYGVAYGCVLRTSQLSAAQGLIQYIYNKNFENNTPPEHILLRDYAQNIVEFGIYKDLAPKVNISKLRPPYQSDMPTVFPTVEDIDRKYKLDYQDDTIPKDYLKQNTILSSMTTEYGRGTGSYGDFGRYVFQSALSNWEVDVNGLSNMAVEWIFEKYGYDPKKHGEYEEYLGYVDRGEPEIERIGKKYQWIALYELLGKVADNCEMRSSWGNQNYTYKGIWNYYIRDINVGYIDRTQENSDENLETESDPTHVNGYWDYTNWDQPLEDWLINQLDLPSVKNIIQREDEEGSQWLSLDSFIKWEEPKQIGEDTYHRSRREIWYIIKSYLIHKEEKKKIVEWLSTQNFHGRWMPESGNTNDVFSRENYWSPASQDDYIETDVWEEIERGNFDVALTTHKSAGEFSQDKSGSHKSYEMPSKIIWTGMDMQYGKMEGVFENASNKVICKCVSPDDPFILKSDFMEFLDRENLEIIWTVLGEKLFVGKDHWVDHSIINGVFTLEKGEISGKINLAKETIKND